MPNRNRLLLSGLVVLLLAALTAAGLMLTRGNGTRSSRTAEGDERARESRTVHVGKSVEDGRAPVARTGNLPASSLPVANPAPNAADKEEENAEPAPDETNDEEAEPPPAVIYQVRGHFEFTGLAGLDLATLATYLDKQTLPFEIRLVEGKETSWGWSDQLPLDGKFATTLDTDSLPLTEDGKLKTGRWEATVALLDGAKPVQIAAPYLGERLLDFGEMNIDLASLLGDLVSVVTGHVLHSSGQVMAGVGLDIQAVNRNTRDSGEPLCNNTCTNEYGIFMYMADLRGCAASGYSWTMSLQGSGGAGAMRLLVPPTAGTVIDFGAITFKCPIVELRAKGWIPDSERLLHAGPEAKIEDLGEPVLNVTFSAFEQQFSGALARSQSKLLMYMAPGNYECSGSVDDPYTDYKDIESSIEVTEEGPLPYTLFLYKASPKAEPQPVAPPARAPAVETPGPGKVKVMLPKLPEPLADTAAEIALIASPRFADAKAWTLLKNPGSQEFWEGELPPGSWDILLTEAGPHFGYENGVVSGPARADVGSNANIVVWLPAVDKPLWKEPVNSFAVKFTCEGQPIELSAPFVLGGGAGDGGFVGVSADYQGSHYFNTSFSGPRQKITLADGDKEIEFAMRPGDGGEGSISHDFPCRVEVRFSRNGAPVTLPCWVRGESADSYRCEVMSTNGKPVLLWLPPGKATISITTVSTEPETFARQVEVKRDARLVVEFALESSRLAVNWAERYKHESNTNWLITDSQGHYVGFASNPARYTKLDPGHYIIAPWYDFERKQAITFNIIAGSDTEVDLPFVTPVDEFAEIVLPYPHDLRPDSGGYYNNAGGYPTGFGDMETARPWLPEITPVSGRCTAEGVVIYLPVGVEFVVFAAVANYDHENGGLVARKSWCMTPRRMKVTSTERLRLGNVWTEGVALATSWDKVTCDFRMAPDNNPLGVYYDQSWRVLPDGGYKLTWDASATGGEPLAHTFQLNLSGTMGMPNRLPEALKREFEEAGLYQP